MTPQQKCAERIYELLPHKKELEFGCEIKNKDFDSIHKIVEFGEYQFTHLQVGFDDVLVSQTQNFYRDFEIIGQPIRLADILLAIKKHITVTEDKDWLPFDVLCRKVIIQNNYNLEKDNIIEQSDSFCESLSEILK